MAEATELSAKGSYRLYIRRKITIIAFIVVCAAGLGVASMTLGSASLSPPDVFRALLGGADGSTTQIVVHIRLARALAALAAGAGLGLSGCVMQAVLLNPLASDYTLGVSQGAAFGAAVAIVLMGAGTVQSTGADAVLIRNPHLVTVAAFAGAISATLAVLVLSRYRGISPESMILAGIAFGSLFSAATVMTQYFASDVQVASIVFWTFGDVGRVSWKELAVMSAVTVPVTVYFLFNRWNYNVLQSGDDAAGSMGVNVGRTRMVGMMLASLVTAVAVSFMGIIAFVGLVSPHLTRRIIGGDYRFLVPGSCAMGALLLLASDTVSRTIIAPIVLPVGAITSFMGAPLFLYLLVKGHRRT